MQQQKARAAVRHRYRLEVSGQRDLRSFDKRVDATEAELGLTLFTGGNPHLKRAFSPQQRARTTT